MDNFRTIQLKDNSKEPAMSGWSGAGATEARLDAFTMVTDTTKNYGVLCGVPSNIIVIDYDTYNLPADERIRYTKESMIGVHGEDILLVKTPSGGFHVYHEYTENVSEWKGTCGISLYGDDDQGFVDIRTSGNYVVGLGSSVNGNSYELLHKGSKIGPMPMELWEVFNQKVMEKSRASTKKKNLGKTSCVGQTDGKTEIETLLKVEKFTNIRWVSEYGFDCDQRGKGTVCPLCKQTHVNNHFFVMENESGVYVKNQSNKCRMVKIKSKVQFTEDEREEINTNGHAADYIKMKRDFEKEVCFVAKTGTYIVSNKDDTISLCPLNKLKERFSNWMYLDDKFKKKSFVEAWMRDPNRKEYLNIDFLPEDCPSDTFNLWRGYAIERVTADGSGSLGPFMDLVNQLTEHNADYFLKWLAFLFQHPGKKPITSPVFTSVQGTGKNTFFDLFARLMGNNLYYETADADNQLFGRFSTALENNKLLFIDEMETGVAFKNASKLKAIITNDRHTIERKGVDSYEITNLSGCVFASNSVTPVKVENSDRRFFAYNPQKNLDQVFFNTWRTWVKNPQNQRSVYDHLMAIDLTQVDWIADRPVNNVYREMKYNAISSFLKWLDTTITEAFPREWNNKEIRCSVLYDNYKMFGHHSHEKNDRAFGKEIKRLIERDNLRGFEKATLLDGRARYTIDREVVFEWLKEKGYTLADSLEQPVSILIEDTDGDY